MIKQIITAASLGALLAGCTCLEQRGDWSRDCDRNYSVNDREFDACKEKVEKKITADNGFVEHGKIVLGKPFDDEKLSKSRDMNSNDDK